LTIQLICCKPYALVGAEAVIKWFRTYDRMTMIDSVLTLDTNRPIDCKEMEKHFAGETDKIIEREISGL